MDRATLPFVSGLVALGAVFYGVLLLVGTLPSWSRSNAPPAAQRSIVGIGAAVVGLLGGALYDPVSQLAQVSVSRGPNAISWENVQRKIVVQANVVGRDLAGSHGRR